MDQTTHSQGADDSVPNGVGTSWKLATVSVLLVGIYVARQTGGLPKQLLWVFDDVLIAIVVALSLQVVDASRRTYRWHMALAGLAILAAVIEGLLQTESILRTSSLLSSYLVAASALFILRSILKERRVSGDTLFGAFAVYLAVGVLFGMIFTTIARYSPAAFEPPQQVIDGETSVYYFSFVTLTSLGYGDIAPVSDAARIIATLEAVIGVILLAALVGRVVGLLVARQSEAASGQPDP